MPFTSKLSPEQWAEARRLFADDTPFTEIARQVGISASAVSKRARREGWAGQPEGGAAARKAVHASPATAGIRVRLALRLYRVVECKIKMMELRMIKELQAYEAADGSGLPPSPTSDEREAFAALIESINQVTELVSEPAPAAGGRKSVPGAINPELTALSADIDPDGLAVASEKDGYRRELAEHLGKILANP